ncbi:hypothetical protein NI17_012785 [Thermobifida halotolerans]|uniref:Uncharacterized protein n=1 Tax=Thermobifida halotolerans TaxID=483545 RepID=A0A399G5M5_9ACTN|nr:hypothetical protein [Thermobifida halotolerans]UOE17778.1 hypothetical protein NI17_012785 [Thermobifida halotolerans]
MNSLALSLFLPRATTQESPFRFLLLDDPVQAMDPAKVAGLARLLSDIARDRQVVVFTHDTRLVEEIRYQRLPATCLEITRGERSKVVVLPKTDPVTQALSDARRFSKRVSREICSEVLPGLCRQAIEAACKDAARHRMIAQGKGLKEIEERFEDAEKLAELAALALFDESSPDKNVDNWVRKHCPDAVQILRTCTKGSHEHVVVNNPDTFVSQTQKLATRIRAAAEKNGGRE